MKVCGQIQTLKKPKLMAMAARAALHIAPRSFTETPRIANLVFLHCRWNNPVGFRSPMRGLVMHVRPISALELFSHTQLTVPTSVLEDLSHNQVLVSSAISGLLAQLIKPLISVASGEEFNWRLLIKSGGMPSSHSAVVTAAATAIGLDRGLSDSLFGLSVVIASIVIYDAQGVRRSVGKQAEVINSLTIEFQESPDGRQWSTLLRNKEVTGTLDVGEDGTNSYGKVGGRGLTKAKNVTTDVQTNYITKSLEPLKRENVYETVRNLPSIKEGQVEMQEIGKGNGLRHLPLKESVGHTKVEVFAGIIFGISVTLISHSMFN